MLPCIYTLMLFPNKDMISSLPRDPYFGGPYVMGDNTPLIHVMARRSESCALIGFHGWLVLALCRQPVHARTVRQ